MTTLKQSVKDRLGPLPTAHPEPSHDPGGARQVTQTVPHHVFVFVLRRLRSQQVSVFLFSSEYSQGFSEGAFGPWRKGLFSYFLHC